jgi:hypothetical protein
MRPGMLNHEAKRGRHRRYQFRQKRADKRSGIHRVRATATEATIPMVRPPVALTSDGHALTQPSRSWPGLEGV